MDKDIVIDFPKIMQKFMDGKGNRRSYSNPVYDTGNRENQMGGDFKGDPIVFKRRTRFLDKIGKDIYEWDYVLIDGEKRLIQINGGLVLGVSDDGHEILISRHTAKEFKIVGEYDFGGKIVIKGINSLNDKIIKMVVSASRIMDDFQNIQRGSKSIPYGDF